MLNMGGYARRPNAFIYEANALIYRSLQICIRKDKKIKTPNLSVANDLIQWLTSVRCVTLYDAFGSNKHCDEFAITRDLVRLIVANQKDVEHVVLQGVQVSCSLNSIFSELNFPHLKKLSIDGLYTPSHARVGLEPEVCPLIPKWMQQPHVCISVNTNFVDIRNDAPRHLHTFE